MTIRPVTPGYVTSALAAQRQYGPPSTGSSPKREASSPKSDSYSPPESVSSTMATPIFTRTPSWNWQKNARFADPSPERVTVPGRVNFNLGIDMAFTHPDSQGYSNSLWARGTQTTAVPFAFNRLNSTPNNLPRAPIVAPEDSPFTYQPRNNRLPNNRTKRRTTPPRSNRGTTASSSAKLTNLLNKPNSISSGFQAPKNYVPPQYRNHLSSSRTTRTTQMTRTVATQTTAHLTSRQTNQKPVGALSSVRLQELTDLREEARMLRQERDQLRAKQGVWVPPNAEKRVEGPVGQKNGDDVPEAVAEGALPHQQAEATGSATPKSEESEAVPMRRGQWLVACFVFGWTWWREGGRLGLPVPVLAGVLVLLWLALAQGVY